LVRIAEPPRSIAVAYDTSTSLAGLVEIIKKGLRVFAEGIEPGQEFVNVMNFEQPFILEEWSDQSWTVQSAILAKTDEGGSSDVEKSVITAARALSERRSARALLLLTDASSPSYAIHDQLWSTLRSSPPHVFAAHVGAGDSDPTAIAARMVEKHIMQDLAAANAGHYAWAPTQAAMDVIFDRAAAWLRRPARYRLVAHAVMAPPPAPGSIEVAVVPAVDPALEIAGGIQPTPRVPRQAPATELILDASGSMLQHLGDRRRIEIARTVLSELVTRTLPPGAPLALRVFGTDRPDSCETHLPVPLAPLDRDAVASFIGGVTPVNLAKTPIAASLRAVAEDLRGVVGPRVVVLVTDGEETCGGVPQAEIEALVAQGIDVRVNVVGFAVEDPVLKDTFRAWAAAGHGRYFDAADEAELEAAVEAAVSVDFRVLDSVGAVVARGTVGAAPVSVPAGSYRVEVGDSDPSIFENVIVEPEQLTRLDYSGG
jgi:hypothetical protein